MAIKHLEGLRIQGSSSVGLATYGNISFAGGDPPEPDTGNLKLPLNPLQDVTVGGNATSQLDESANKYGVEIESTNPLIGKTLESFTMALRKRSSPTGNIYAKKYNSSGTLQATSSNYIDASTLPTEGNVLFENKTWNFSSGTLTIADGDRIVFEGGSHDGSNQITFSRNSGGFTDTVSIALYTSSWTTPPSGDPIYKLTATDDSTNGATTTAFTIAFWVKSNSGFTGSSTNADTIMGTYDGASSNGDHFLIAFSSGSSEGLIIKDGSVTNAEWGTDFPQSSINDNAWHHVAITRPASSSTVTAYLDGVDKGDEHYGGRMTSNLTNTRWLSIGGRGDGHNVAPVCSIQDMGFWSREVSASDIAEMATGKPIEKITGYATDLTSYYKLDGDYTDSNTTPPLTSAWVQATGGSDSEITSGTSSRGEKFTGVVPAGKLKSATFSIKKSGTPAGTVTCQLYNSSGTSVEQATETYNNSSLTTSFVDKTFTFSGDNALTSNGWVAITVTGGNGGIFLNKHTSSYGSPTYISALHYDSGSWSHETNARSYVGEIFVTPVNTGTAGGQVTLASSGGKFDSYSTDEKTTITNVPAGTRYEEVDTKKIFRFGETGRTLTAPQGNYTLSGNSFTRSGTGWTAYVTVANGDLASANPSITSITGAGGESEYIAFTWLDGSGLPRGRSSGSWDENTMSYGFYFTSNSGDGALIRVDGTNANGYSPVSYSSSDIFKILMTSTDVKFYKNDSLIHTCNSTSGSGSSSEVPDSSKTYYLIGAINSNGGTLQAKSPTLDWVEKGTA